MGGEFFTDFKSSNRIKLSWLVQVLLNFYWIWGSPRGWQVGGLVRGWVWVCGGCSMHACTCTCMHVVNMIKMDASMGVAICNFYTCIHVCTCVCIHAYMCAHGWGHPQCSQNPHPVAPPQSCRGPKTPKFNKSWTNQDISILFEDSLPLNISELIWTIVGHPRHPLPTCPTPEPRKPKSEDL